MAIDIMPATDEQIALFKLGAAQRYLELNVPPAIAAQVFDAKMAAIQKAMCDYGTGEINDKNVREAGEPAEVAKKVEGVSAKAKIEPAKAGAKKDKEASAKIQKLASAIAAKAGVERKSKKA